MKAIKITDFRKKLKSIGGSYERTSGSHEIWLFPNGTTVSVAGGKGNHGEVSPGVVRNITKTLKNSGYNLE